VRVQHSRHRRTVVLRTAYVVDSVELGYATTVHTAQGVTADTLHGLATGAESRQQLYTMLTWGRASNQLYLQVVGDGDPPQQRHFRNEEVSGLRPALRMNRRASTCVG
jgi:ATP-dependent exoDNAse (exonuclease V) alpha subunit